MRTHHAPRRIVPLSIALVTAVAGVAVGVAPSASGAVAAAPTYCSDTAAPAAASFAMSPRRVDVRAAAGKVHVKVPVTDGLVGSGVADVIVSVESPAAHGIGRGFSARLKRTSGTALNGTWKGTLTFRRFTNNGTWTITSLEIDDRVGNSHTYTTADLSGAGLPTTIKVRSHPDLIKPKVHDFSFSPRHPDSTHGAKRVRVSATVTDRGGSQVRTVWAGFGRYDPNHGTFGSSVQLRHRPGSNEFVGHLTVPVHADRESPAVWDVTLYAIDHADNVRGFTTGGLHNAGWPSMLTVINKADAHVPRLTTLSFAPDTFDTSAGQGLVHVVAHFADAGTGVRSAQISFTGTDGEGYGAFRLTHGTNHDGTWRATAVFPRCSSGTMTADVLVFDGVGNQHDYSDTDLSGLTLPWFVTATAS